MAVAVVVEVAAVVVVGPKFNFLIVFALFANNSFDPRRQKFILIANNSVRRQTFILIANNLAHLATNSSNSTFGGKTSFGSATI